MTAILLALASCFSAQDETAQFELPVEAAFVARHYRKIGESSVDGKSETMSYVSVPGQSDTFCRPAPDDLNGRLCLEEIRLTTTYWIDSNIQKVASETTEYFWESPQASLFYNAFVSLWPKSDDALSYSLTRYCDGESCETNGDFFAGDCNVSTDENFAPCFMVKETKLRLEYEGKEKLSASAPQTENKNKNLPATLDPAFSSF